MARMQIEKIGYGVGTRVVSSRPNVLRAVLGEMEAAPACSYLTDSILRIETNVDDLSPEIVGAVLGKLFDAGALDAFFTPIQMKKHRPGILLTVLCAEPDAGKIAGVLFRETTSFGIRMDRVDRWKLDRKFETVSTPFGEITVKLGLHGRETLQAAPEFESCRVAAERTGQPLRAVYEAAIRALPAKGS